MTVKMVIKLHYKNILLYCSDELSYAITYFNSSDRCSSSYAPAGSIFIFYSSRAPLFSFEPDNNFSFEFGVSAATAEELFDYYLISSNSDWTIFVNSFLTDCVNIFSYFLICINFLVIP